MSRVDYGLWLRRVATWDGVLPACVAAAPCVIRMLVRGQLGVAVAMIAAVTLPAVAFELRLLYGRNRIASNYCSTSVRRLQSYALYIGLFTLALIDFILFYCQAITGGKAKIFEGTSDWIGFALCVAIYVTAMVFAMYPGAVGQSESEDWEQCNNP